MYLPQESSILWLEANLYLYGILLRRMIWMRKYRFAALFLAVVLAVSVLSTAAAAHGRPTRYDIDVEVEGKGSAWTSPTVGRLGIAPMRETVKAAA